MGLFDRFHRRLTEPTSETRDLGPGWRELSAVQAYRLAADAVYDVDREARWTAVSSDTGLGGDGRSMLWEFCFDLPRLQGSANVTLLFGEEEHEVEDRTLLMHLELQPAGEGVEPAGPSLPADFVDSPEVTATLVQEEGLELDDGARDLCLSARARKGCAPRWTLCVRDDEFTTPFAA